MGLVNICVNLSQQVHQTQWLVHHLPFIHIHASFFLLKDCWQAFRYLPSALNNYFDEQKIIRIIFKFVYTVQEKKSPSDLDINSLIINPLISGHKTFLENHI